MSDEKKISPHMLTRASRHTTVPQSGAHGTKANGGLRSSTWSSHSQTRRVRKTIYATCVAATKHFPAVGTPW